MQNFFVESKKKNDNTNLFLTNLNNYKHSFYLNKNNLTFHNYLFNMMISDDINQRDSSESNRKNIAISKQSFFSVNPVFLVNKNFFLLINMLLNNIGIKVCDHTMKLQHYSLSICNKTIKTKMSFNNKSRVFVHLRNLNIFVPL